MIQARSSTAEADDLRARLREEAERAEDALAICAKLAGQADRLQADADSCRDRADDSERQLVSAAADISRLEQALDRAKAEARAARDDGDAARADQDRAEDGCASLRARLEDLLGQTEDAAARGERQLYEVRMRLRVWAGVLPDVTMGRRAERACRCNGTVVTISETKMPG